MLAKAPTQGHRISWPLNAQKVEAIDNMFQTLYKTAQAGVFLDYEKNQDDATILYVKNNSANASASAGLFFKNDTVASPGLQYNSSDNASNGGKNSFNIFAGTNDIQYNDLAMWVGTSTTPAIFIDGATGFIGVNDITPSVAIDVTGSVTVTGTLTAGTLSGSTAGMTWTGNKIGLLYGGTNADLSATGGAGQILKQSSSGAAITVAALAFSDTTGTVSLARGGTNADLSATGGTNQLLKQDSSGAAITVGTIASSNLSNSANIPLLNATNTFSASLNTFSNGINVGAGSASSPGIYFGTNNTGIYGAASSSIDFTQAGALIFSVGNEIDSKNQLIRFNTTASGSATPSLGTTAPSSASLVWVRISVSGTTKYFPAWG